jgi:hypothetical protein
MYVTLWILSSTCSSLFSFLCELSSNQPTPSVSVSTKLFLLSFHVLPSFHMDILPDLLFISLSWSLEHFSYTCWLRTFFGTPDFGNVKNTSPLCLCGGSESSFISRSYLTASAIIMTLLLRITESPLWVSPTSGMSPVSLLWWGIESRKVYM